METQPRNPKRPPRVIETVLKCLTPRASRESVLGDLKERYLSTHQYMWDGARGLRLLVKCQVRRSFNMKLLAVEACGLVISFAGTPILALALYLALALVVLVLRDAHIHPAQRSLDEVSGDAMAVVFFVFLLQALLWIVSPSRALPDTILIRSAAMSLLMVSTLRIVFRGAPHMKMVPAGGLPPLELYRVTGRINFLWMTATLGIVLTNPEAIPESIPGRDFLLGGLPVILFGLARRLQQNGLARNKATKTASILFRNSYRDELVRKRDRLWRSGASKFSGFAEILTLVVLLVPLLIAFWALLSGHGADVDWFRLGFNLAALVTLSALWIYIRKMNLRAARSLQGEIGALNRAGTR